MLDSSAWLPSYIFLIFSCSHSLRDASHAVRFMRFTSWEQSLVTEMHHFTSFVIGMVANSLH